MTGRTRYIFAINYEGSAVAKSIAATDCPILRLPE